MLLGAGFDSRPVRFAAQLADTRTFVVDMPQVLRLRAEHLASLSSPETVIDVPIDFAVDDRLRSEIAPGELERRYLAQLPGRALKSWGCFRIAHVERVG